MLLCFLLAWDFVAPGTALALGLGIALGLLFLDCGLVLEPSVREAVQAVAVAGAPMPRHEIVQ